MPGGFDSLRSGRKSRRGLVRFEPVYTTWIDAGQVRITIPSGAYRCLLCGKVRASLLSLKRHDRQKHQGRLKPTNVYTKQRNAGARTAALLLAAGAMLSPSPFGQEFRTDI